MIRSCIARYAARAAESSLNAMALREERAFPSLVRGPVDFNQGFVARISLACLARRCGVQPDLVPMPVQFVLHEIQEFYCTLNYTPG